MLYRIGTVRELQNLSLPDVVYREILRCTEILDKEYGENRDYIQSGGYTIFCETKDDIEKVREIIDFERHPCEWADVLYSDNEIFVSALYLLNDDYSLVVIMPAKDAPPAIQAEMEDWK